MMSLPLSPQVFAITSALIEEKTGICHDPGDREALAEKLSQRAVERGFDSLLDYYYSLRYDADAEIELKALVETLVVQETYLFRESDALKALVDVVLPERLEEAERAGRRARVWSAACATGEEPVTLAMLLDQRGILDRVELIASDISVRGLERAREGIFGGRALRAFPDAMRAAYTTTLPGGRVLVDPQLGRRIQWRSLNLIDSSAVAAIGSVDAIVCRNVLIYFGDEGCRRVATSLSNALAPGGVLLVGASESLLRFGIFHCEERAGSFFYRRPSS
jgi:chemotaxis protein methyltransferase CheR